MSKTMAFDDAASRGLCGFTELLGFAPGATAEDFLGGGSRAKGCGLWSRYGVF